MDETRFDALTRGFAERTTRRPLLKLLAAAGTGVLLPARGAARGRSAGGRLATATADVGDATGVLLAAYDLRSAGGVDWSYVRYRPRQFVAGLRLDDPTLGPLRVDEAGTYGNWDLLTTYNASVHRVSTRDDWLQVTLNRAATLAVVWRSGGPVPGWLSVWMPGEAVVIDGIAARTFRRRVAAGETTLGSVFDPVDNPENAWRDTYWLLLAEADGRPSRAPTVPPAREAPRPNETCPDWLHDRHITTGPDGRPYPTWHPQIDRTYWCYYRHEHGSDPAFLSAADQPPFGYVAAAHGMEEPHTGFKNYLFDDGSCNRWLVTHHFGTAGLGRVCTRFHTVGIMVRSLADGELLADLHLMADFGASVVNRTQEAITPAACPDQAALAAGSSGVRQIAAVSADTVFYEPWRTDFAGNVLGLIGTFTVNTPDAIVVCDDARCDHPVETKNSGSFRFFTPNQGFKIVARDNHGTFFTDPRGLRLVPPGEPGAVRQFVKPGVVLSIVPGDDASGHCYDVHAWGRPLVCGAVGAGATNREGSLRPPN